MTKVIRAASLDDMDGILQCSEKAGAGLINLPKNRELLEKRILNTQSALGKEVKHPQGEDYLFVLEDGKQIQGTCGIYADLGATHPFYTFHIDRNAKRLIKKVYPSHFSELCALYLSPDLRKEGFGKLLSLSRFLFIASDRKRFHDSILANMRGYTIDHRSPFWEAIGQKVLPLDFHEVMSKRALDESFIESILPDMPIDISSLPLAAQECIGKIHTNTVPAVKLLQEEGFSLSDDIDPIDGGPILIAKICDVPAVTSSVINRIAGIKTKEILSPSYLISNNDINFRACYGNLEITKEGVFIHKEIADTLEIDIGDKIRYVRFDSKKN